MKRESIRSAAMPSFIVMDVMERAKELEREGRSIVHLEIGEPDFDTPEVVKKAAERALEEGMTGYSHSLGVPELREAVAEHYRSSYGVDVTAEQVIVTAGTSPALLLIFSALLDSGDEVVMTDPCYACYPNYVRFLGGEARFVAVSGESGFAPSPQAIKDAITPKTKAVIINSPGNPTGCVIPEDVIREISRITEEAGVYLISDEIYHGVTYGSASHSALEFTSNAFALNGFSKRYAMPGWRLGYIIAPLEFVRGIQRMQQNFFLCANHFVQWAGITALNETSEEVRRMIEIYDKRRRYLVPELRRLGFEIPSEPDGAFYVFAGARKFTSDSLAFAYELLENAGVAVTPGIDFGAGGEGHIRLSYATSMENLREGVKRLSDYLPTLLH